MNKYNRIMEFFWLVTAVLTLLLGAYIINQKGFGDNNWVFLFFPLLASAMYAMRRHLRKKEEKKLN